MSGERIRLRSNPAPGGAVPGGLPSARLRRPEGGGQSGLQVAELAAFAGVKGSGEAAQTGGGEQVGGLVEGDEAPASQFVRLQAQLLLVAGVEAATVVDEPQG